jgi:hypothetical protein
MPFTNDDFFRVIGHISVFFATWDLFTTLLLMRLMKPERPLPSMERRTLGQKLKLLEGLKPDHVVDPGLLDRIHADLPAAYPVSEERNRYIHGQWLFAPELIATGQIRLLSIRVEERRGDRGLTLPWIQYRIGDLHNFLNVLGQQQKIFGDFVAELMPPKVPGMTDGETAGVSGEWTLSPQDS